MRIIEVLQKVQSKFSTLTEISETIELPMDRWRVCPLLADGFGDALVSGK